MAPETPKKADDASSTEDVGYISINNVAVYNPTYPRLAAAAAAANPPAGGNLWVAPESWERIPDRDASLPPPPPLSLAAALSAAAASVAPGTPPPANPDLPHTPPQLHLRSQSSQLLGASLAHLTATIHTLNRYASDPTAAEASDAAANQLAAHAIASASDPATAEAIFNERSREYHVRLARTMLEGGQLTDFGRPVTHDGRPVSRDDGPSMHDDRPVTRDGGPPSVASSNTAITAPPVLHGAMMAAPVEPMPISTPADDASVRSVHTVHNAPNVHVRDPQDYSDWVYEDCCLCTCLEMIGWVIYWPCIKLCPIDYDDDISLTDLNQARPWTP